MDCEASIHHMLSTIHKKRKEMMGLAEIYGFTDEHTLKCSQELDELINEYYRLTIRKKYRHFLLLETGQRMDEADFILSF